MNRRGFLKMAGWGSVSLGAIHLLPADGFDEVVFANNIKFPNVYDGPAIDMVDFRTVVQRIAITLAQKVQPSPVLQQTEGLKVGDMPLGEDGRRFVMTSQYNIGQVGSSGAAAKAGRMQHGGHWRVEELDQVAMMFAEHIERSGINVYGRLALPMGCEEAVMAQQENGPPVRGVIWYDIHHDDEWLYRFDILGGKAA